MIIPVKRRTQVEEMTVRMAEFARGVTSISL
jgi:hypothetical protein